MKTLEEVRQVLQEQETILADRYGVRIVGVFGSYVRGEQREDSDIDLDAMDKAQILVQDVSFARFAADFRINFAVVRALEMIGEDTKRLPDHVRAAYPDVPRRGMAGMRDRIIHGYDTVDLQIVWDVVAKDIPTIKPYIMQILQGYQS